MTFHRILVSAALSLSISACGPHEGPCDSGPSSSSSSSTGTAPHVCPPLEERGGAGAACVEDCDCCGSACGYITQADGTVARVCASPCPVPSTP